jgi:predicted N-formylglutamate amidohydrolase
MRMPDASVPLLGPDEERPPFVVNEGGASAILLVCDHAGRKVPARLGDLGVAAPDFERHIAWDVGAEGVARRLAQSLDAVLIGQPYCRLVIDCNRPPDVASSIPEISETTPIPGNVRLDGSAREARRRAIFEPYHARIAAELDRRRAQRRAAILVAVHSFTPVYTGVSRPWQIGLLSARDRRFAEALLPLLRAEPDLAVGDNEPYDVSDETDYTIPVHGERRGIPHVGLEIRQDLIADPAGQAAWAGRLARLLPVAVAALRER